MTTNNNDSSSTILNVPAEGKKQANVPNLRFDGYYSNWKKYHLKNVVKFSKGYGITKDQLSSEGIPCILYGELYTTYKSEVIKEIKSRTNFSNRNLVYSKANDVILPSSGETPEDIAKACCVPIDNVLLGGDLNILRPNKDRGSFISYQLNGKRKYDIAKLAQGASIVHLHNEHLQNLCVFIPELLEEQDRIISFLTKIDKRIETQSKIIEKLESQMNAISYRIINGLKGNIVYLSEISKIYQPETITQSEFVENGKYPVYGANGLIGYYDRYNHEAEQICVTCRGASCGTVNLSSSRSWITGNSMVVNTDHNKDVNKFFVYYFLKNYNFKKIISGSGQPQIVREPMEKIKICLPSIIEQNAIVIFLKSLDYIIKTEKDILSAYKKQKVYLLQEMFI